MKLCKGMDLFPELNWENDDCAETLLYKVISIHLEPEATGYLYAAKLG